jgi:N6-L-threonylcarbamoyladenine synthase
MRRFAALHPGKPGLLVVAGGVAANRAIRDALEEATREEGFRLAVPPVALCTDNAVMVAWAGLERLRASLADAEQPTARPRWPLECLGGG